ncbi:hypothetical protein [Methanobrevibacter sp.]|uniref:hypothetical protein n=1 Tax=Methanobrevibacter sp. TaxID=66852 RepID=UPI00388F813D
MDIITTIIYIALFIIMMIFVFSIGMLKTYMPKKEVLLVLLVAFLIGSIGGAFFLEPIYKEVPSVMKVVERNMPNTDETLYLDLSSSIDLNELYQNLSNTEGFKSYDEESITIPLWKFSDMEQSYFERIVGNIDSHYGNYTVNQSGTITIELKDNYTATQALKSFSDWYKLVYGTSLSYAKVHSKLVIDSYNYDEFQQNLLQRGIVASALEGPIQNDLNSTSTGTISNTYFVLITGIIGVIVALMGIYVDSVVVYYRRFKKFMQTKRKR